ncbi:hypothetical protein [Corynebacterium pseudopelargi]|uniref:ABC transporter domain-containing protein n=1 Tax=Corynebacterium pseudopelargi TaxID=2080757 RepID=A0A3G6ISJ9_9CORY|nr:hypothetical protein [Corynebacterium pseudopelargi]AZA08467.1 hypothetical protein CPPEL_01600 [Corynebacterium pseudopelargi]
MDRQRTSTSKMQAVLQTRELVLVNGDTVPDLDILPGLTLMHCNPLLDAATLAMTIGGRLASKSGEVLVRSGHKRLSNKKVIQKSIALAGVPEVDSIEPRVPIRSIVREQVVWTSHWWQQVPKELSQIDRYQQAAKLLDFHLDDDQAKTTAPASLNPLESFQLRIVLALIARPEASVLLVNDIDGVRNVALRRELLQRLQGVAEKMAVVVLSTNALDKELCHHFIDLDNNPLGQAFQAPPQIEAPKEPARPNKQIDVPSFQKPHLDYRRRSDGRAGTQRRRSDGEFQKPKPQIVAPPKRRQAPQFPPRFNGPRT